MATGGNGSSSVIHSDGSASSVDNDYPQRKESFSTPLRNILDEEFRKSLNTFSDDPKLKKTYEDLSGILKNQSDSFERAKNILEQVIPRYNAKYQRLQKLVDAWKPTRRELIRKLSSDIQKLDRNFKWSTIIRFLTSSVEVIGTVGGLKLQPETSWANHAFNAASFCGVCGLFFTVAELDRSKRILDELSEVIEEDNRLLHPILKCFEESEELDSVVQELFPHGIDTDIVRQIQAASTEQANYLNIFKAGLMTNLKKDNQLYENSDFLHSLLIFSTSEVAAVWWNRIIYRSHPVALDLGKMALQIEFGQLQSIIFQCIPALPLEQQRLSSLPVAGRIVLNILTMYESAVDLKKGAKSSHSDKVRRHLKHMEGQLENIENTVLMMKPAKLRID